LSLIITKFSNFTSNLKRSIFSNNLERLNSFLRNLFTKNLENKGNRCPIFLSKTLIQYLRNFLRKNRYLKSLWIFLQLSRNFFFRKNRIFTKIRGTAAQFFIFFKLLDYLYNILEILIGKLEIHTEHTTNKFISFNHVRTFYQSRAFLSLPFERLQYSTSHKYTIFRQWLIISQTKDQIGEELNQNF